ncbi:MAG: hypothetical protein ACLP5V_03715 [Candidatus Bathyarchaeia archaeon]
MQLKRDIRPTDAGDNLTSLLATHATIRFAAPMPLTNCFLFHHGNVSGRSSKARPESKEIDCDIPQGC